MKLRAHNLYPSRRSAVLADKRSDNLAPFGQRKRAFDAHKRWQRESTPRLPRRLRWTLVEQQAMALDLTPLRSSGDGKQLHGLNASGRSPAGWNPERFDAYDQMPFAAGKA
jgi:gamma-glutamyltranspeptidase/glutathione hydrolase